MSAELIVGVWVKIHRAQQHLVELEERIGWFHEKKPYRIVTDKDSEPGHELYRFHFNEAIPIELSGVVGDIIHNLRAALDNMATALAFVNGNTSRNALKQTYFPIGSSKESFDHKLDRDLARASAEARRMVKRMKPYKGGTDAFWRLHQLDILDKHTAIIPVGASHSRVGIKFPVAEMFKMIGIEEDIPELPFVSFNPAQIAYPLNDGDVIFKYGLGSDVEGKMKGDFQFTFDIAFGEGQIVDGQPVVPTLKQLIDFTERVVTFFARNFFA